MQPIRLPVPSRAALVRSTDELGPVSILVNNAGGAFSSPLLDTTPKGWDALLRANLGHVLLCPVGSDPGRASRSVDRALPRNLRLPAIG